MRVNDLVADIVMEYKLGSYRVKMAATNAVLNLDADAKLLQGEEILVEDLADGKTDPRTGK